MVTLVPIDWFPTASKLTRFGYLSACFIIAFGWLAAHGHRPFGVDIGRSGALAFYASGAAVFLLSTITPRVLLLLYVPLVALSSPIGYVLSYVVLGVVFFGIMLPIGLLLRRIGREPIRQGSAVDVATYWLSSRPPRVKEDYFRQY
jgi:Saxitoxin biosynthesis operon protein SxtJ